jgi:hypothetical protein
MQLNEKQLELVGSEKQLELVKCKNGVWQSAFRAAGGHVAGAKSLKYPVL